MSIADGVEEGTEMRDNLTILNLFAYKYQF